MASKMKSFSNLVLGKNSKALNTTILNPSVHLLGDDAGMHLKNIEFTKT